MAYYYIIFNILNRIKLSLRAKDHFWISFDPIKIQYFHQRLPTAESHSVARLSNSKSSFASFLIWEVIFHSLGGHTIQDSACADCGVHDA